MFPKICALQTNNHTVLIKIFACKLNEEGKKRVIILVWLAFFATFFREKEDSHFPMMIKLNKNVHFFFGEEDIIRRCKTFWILLCNYHLKKKFYVQINSFWILVVIFSQFESKIFDQETLLCFFLWMKSQ